MDSERPSADILSVADAFMNRRRTPVEDDVPVLTEVVDQPSTVTPAAEALAPPPLLDETRKQALQRELEEWLDLQMPQVVLRVLDGVADQMIGHLGEQARAVLLPRLLAALEGADEGKSQD
ncbi:MAG TPA: hypothetical protein VI279_02220 [Rhodocyclaceae bacterium]